MQAARAHQAHVIHLRLCLLSSLLDLKFNIFKNALRTGSKFRAKTECITFIKMSFFNTTKLTASHQSYFVLRNRQKYRDVDQLYMVSPDTANYVVKLKDVFMSVKLTSAWCTLRLQAVSFHCARQPTQSGHQLANWLASWKLATQLAYFICFLHLGQFLKICFELCELWKHKLHILSRLTLKSIMGKQSLEEAVKLFLPNYCIVP